jgi:gluconate 2-dehydrogenase gamma chain
MSQAEWRVAARSATEGEQPLFFTAAEWAVVEAATARIIPTDHDPGAREAKVVRFIDRFLSGIDYVYAAADGSGFLDMDGKDAEAWRLRVAERGQVYRRGIAALEALSRSRSGRGFAELGETEQDAVLEELSGRSKPKRVTPDADDDRSGGGGPPPTNQPVDDEGLGFFDLLVFHTRQGFYADPVYGGNADFIGWQVIGFPGPASLADTMDGTYTTVDYLPDAGGTDQEGPAET